MKLKFFPLYLFILFFLIDKLFLLKPVQKLFVQNTVNAYDMTHDFQWKTYQKNKSKLENASSIFFIGTSRSDKYGLITPEDFLMNPYVEEKELLSKNWRVNSDFSVKAASPLLLFHSFDFMLQKGVKPKVFVLETSFSTLNKNSLFVEKSQMNDMKLNFFWKYRHLFNLEEKVDYLSTRVFVLNRMNIPWIGLITGKSSAGSEAPTALLDFIIGLSQVKSEKKLEENGFKVVGEEEGKESEMIKEKNQKYIQYLIQRFFNSFETYHPSYMRMYREFARLCKEQGIQLVFYSPPVHKLYTQAKEPFHRQELLWKKEMESIAREFSVLYLDFESKIPLKCRFFEDISHISSSCYPEVVEKILLKSGNLR